MQPSVIFLAVGLLASGIAIIGGILFTQSEEFAVGKISCVVGPDTDADDTNCNKEKTVLGLNGKPCQIGRIGLYESLYDPSCADGTDYEVSKLIPKFDGPTTEFPLLFPSQTNLAGIKNAPKFKDCDTYFDATLTGFTSLVTSAGLSDGLEAFQNATKLTYDNNIALVFPGIRKAMSDLPINVSDALGAAVGTPTPEETDTTFVGGSTLDAFLLANLLSLNTVLRTIANLYNHGKGDPSVLGSVNFEDILTAGLTRGTPLSTFQLPVNGTLWARYDHPVLCAPAPFLGSCNIYEFFVILNGLLPSEQLTSALNLIGGYQGAVVTATRTLAEVDTGIATGDAAVLADTSEEKFRAFYEALLSPDMIASGD